MVELKLPIILMEQKNVSKRVTATILSMSLLTVMAGAAIAPALGIIKAHFASAPDLLVQLIVSMPALLIIITNILFLQLVRRVRTRTIATIGLLLYVAAGAGCFFVDCWVLVSASSCRCQRACLLIISLLSGKQGSWDCRQP